MRALLQAWVGHDPAWAPLVSRWRDEAAAPRLGLRHHAGVGVPTRVLRLPLAGQRRVSLDA